MAQAHQVIEDAELGFRRLEPMPTPEELGEFYRRRYYEEIQRRAASSSLQRLARDDPRAAREREWLRATVWADLVDALGEAPGRRVLEVGCGAGDLLAHLAEHGFEGVGVEPSQEAAQAARAKGVRIAGATLEDLPADAGRFDAVLLMNVLEHVPDPVGLLRLIHARSNPHAILCVRVPNEFNALQLAASARLNRPPWWIAVPDHVNYFDFGSLAALLAREGFEVLRTQADFPMELFLLMGEDYLADPSLGSACHQRRVSLELSLPAEVRRRLYAALAQAGLGRNCLALARAR